MTRHLSGAEVAQILELAPLPVEGGLVRQTLHDGGQSAIYYLLIAPDFSALHRLPGPEIWHFYAGAALEMLLLHDDGTSDVVVLGPDLPSGQRPQVIVPGGSWQGGRSTGEWTLVGTTMTPPYEGSAVRFAVAAELSQRWEDRADLIAELTRAAGDQA
ncbi:MAG TPA: cupin domain-containing protein [Egibacteraceae bacterium]|nr:cupin domain-containing protein [Egibacteraceae bacterium]